MRNKKNTPDTDFIKEMRIAKYTARTFYNKYFTSNPFIELEEVYCEAYFIMVNACYSWEPDKGRSLKNWIIYKIRRELKRAFLKKKYAYENSHVCHNIPYDEICSYSANQLDLVLFKEKIKALSQISKSIIKNYNIVEAEKESPRAIRKEIWKHLEKKGITRYRIKACVKELKTVFSNG